jgi:hypothetical protein
MKKETDKETEIVEVQPTVVKPAVSPREAKENWSLFQNLKRELLDTSDYARIQKKKYICKSGFRKLAVAFNISDEILAEERTEREDGSFFWRIKAKATAPNGRTSIGVAICDSRERKFAHVEHDVYATAHTRAKNRAISDLVAGGVVSAEEMQTRPQPRPQPEPKKNENPQAKEAKEAEQGHLEERDTARWYEERDRLFVRFDYDPKLVLNFKDEITDMGFQGYWHPKEDQKHPLSWEVAAEGGGRLTERQRNSVLDMLSELLGLRLKHIKR